MMLDEIDKLILNHLQEGFPIGPSPFASVADELTITEADLLDRLARLKSDRFITRFGPFFDAEALGGAFCLCAITVPEEDFETVVTKVNARIEVAHNYKRCHHLNMWFVLATETIDKIEQVADDIEAETGLQVHRFPKLQEFFIRFRVAA